MTRNFNDSLTRHSLPWWKSCDKRVFLEKKTPRNTTYLVCCAHKLDLSRYNDFSTWLVGIQTLYRYRIMSVGYPYITPHINLKIFVDFKRHSNQEWLIFQQRWVFNFIFQHIFGLRVKLESTRHHARKEGSWSDSQWCFIKPKCGRRKDTRWRCLCLVTKRSVGVVVDTIVGNIVSFEEVREEC